ncbi:(2Fe-2S)-binding protein [Spirochaetia bacterium]|nr:(2Fe-2S)-binding protein [Spirochaetia bacterium]
MTISFILNGEDEIINADPSQRLIDILRNEFHLCGAKSGCLAGRCGVCSVMFNGAVSPSCIIPAFRIKASEIITIEGFSKNDEYKDIILGFKEANVENCGYCDAGKILTAESLLSQNKLPSRNEITAALGGIKCRCTEVSSLCDGVIAAAVIRRRRLNVRNN